MISIIIATFNSEKVLRSALDSIASQSFKDWECIIVDGASRDDTIKIVEEYEKKDSRFRHISEPDKGIYDAFNKGWKMAKGEWVYYLGSDDTLCEGALETFSQVDNLIDYDVVYGDVLAVSANGNVREVHSNDYHMIWYRFFGSHQSVFMKRSAIEKLGGFNLKYKVKADFALVQKAFVSGCKFKQYTGFVARFALTGASNAELPWFDNERYQIMKDNKSTSFPAVVTLWLGCFLHFRKLYYSIKGM